VRSRCATDAAARRGLGGEPCRRDGLSASFARAVGATVEPLDGRVDLSQVALDLEHERGDL
jgi:hypothetical protein